METGIDPENWLAAMLNPLIFGSVIPMLDGRCPWNWLDAISTKINEVILKIKGEIVPDNLFTVTERNASLVNWPKESGIIPPKLLCATEIFSKDDKFPKEGGIAPVRLFLKSAKYRSFDKLPSIAGISPVNRLPPK